MSQKKARQFDLDSMLSEARATAIERCQESLSSRTQDLEVSVDKESKNKKPHSTIEVTAKKSEGEPQKQQKPESDDDEDEFVGPPLAAMFQGADAKTGEDTDESDEEETEENALDSLFPISHEVEMKHGDGDTVVSALALDPSGARLVTGSYSYDVKFWDFAGMDASLRSFRSTQPCESHPIKDLRYSSTGDNVLVISGNAQAKVLDRDGFEVMECPRGYPYISDMASTKGHTAMLNGGAWNPKIKQEFMTCSNDGSMRLWDVGGKKHKFIVKMKAKTGRRDTPTTCCYSNDGSMIAGAGQDGSIQIWDYRKFVNVALKNYTAHMAGCDTSSLCFSYDNRVIASRGGDDTLKLWDIRNFKQGQPLEVVNDLYNRYPMTDVCFSPNDRMVLTGTSIRKGDKNGGRLLCYAREGLEKVLDLPVCNSDVIRTLWHPKLNQIVVGCGNGTARVYYDPDHSHRGAMLCATKKPRQNRDMEFVAHQTIITPYALKMFREEKEITTQKRRNKDRKDPIKSKQPTLPVTGPGRDGQVSAHGSTLAQFVSKQWAMRKPNEGDKDPRAAILRHAEDAAKNPYWLGNTYAESQPKPIFQDSGDESDEDGTGTGAKKAKLN